MKKLLSIILSLVLLFGIIPLGTVTANAATNYNPSAAVTYASQHWYDGIGLCATFVSNCLKAGGCTVSSSTVTSLWGLLKNNGWGTSYTLTKSSYYIYKSDNSTKLSAGDPIFYYCNICDGWQHVVLCSGYDSSGKAMAYGHNDAWDNKTTLGGFIDAKGHTGSSIVAYSIHMNVTPILTIKYHANGGYIKSDKKDEIYIDSSGLMRKYSTNDYYSNNWTYRTSYSNGLINASSFGVVKDGYKFAGWSLSKNGGTVYDQTTARKPEDIYPDLKNGSATITMYAVWEPNVLTIEYFSVGDTYIKKEKVNKNYINTDGLICKVSSKAAYSSKWKYGTTYSDGLIDDTTFGIVRDGYKFKEWAFINDDESLSFYNKKTPLKPEQIYPKLKNGNAVIQMLAVWEPYELKVVCNANGGDVLSSKYYTDDEGIIINRETGKPSTTSWRYGEKRENGFTDDTTFGMTKKCHEFVGWSISKSGTKVYDKATALAPETFYPDINKGDATVTVYAIWKETNHTYSNSSDTVCNECGKTRQLGSQLIKEGSVTYYYYNGVKSTSTGIFDYNGKKIYINKGRFLGATGLVTIGGKKMYINKGYFTGASGLVTIGGKKMYINKGYFTGASGLVTIKGKKMYINKGYFTGASGLVTIKGKKMYINKGYFLGATGIVKIGSKRYYIKKGYAQLSFSGKVKISGKTYTIKKGIVK